MDKKMAIITRPELIIGLIGAVGTDLNIISEKINNLLQEYGYSSDIIQLSDFIKLLKKIKWKELIDCPEDKRINSYMTRGNELRKITKRNDILAILAITKIQSIRKRTKGDSKIPIDKHAFILKSLKHPDEIRSLKEIYGNNFIALSVYSQREIRLQKLAAKIAESHQKSNIAPFRQIAEELIRRDESEEIAYGQYVREAFPLGDIFIDSTDPIKTEEALERSFDLIFGHPFITPTKHEIAMAIAYIAALRSSSSARQVGAAITDSDGEIISIGTNDVPKVGGGLYWEGEQSDFRDHVFEYDVSDVMRKNLLGEILEKMKEIGWLSKRAASKDINILVKEALKEGNPPPLRRCQFMDIIEYGRSVHAEMAAICNAAIRGISIKGCNLYVTTFPCHECARHIVMSGIKNVYYIEPYPKSRVIELYSDSIAVESKKTCNNEYVNFLPFEGISPKMYMKIFMAGQKREKSFGKIARWKKREAIPIVLDKSAINVLINEQKEIRDIVKILKEKSVSF